MSLDRSALAAAIRERGVVVRAVITGFEGSSPRETGASMLVWASGQSGSIGGGALELAVTEQARAMLGDATPFLRQAAAFALGPALGQCCGGAVRLLMERLTERELSAIPAGVAFARPVATGENSRPLAVSRLLRLARVGQPLAPALLSGWFVEPVAAPAAPVWLYGAGHVGRAIVRVLDGLPFAVSWIDTSLKRYPDAIPEHIRILPAANPADAVALAPDDAVHLVLTFSHALDLEICHRVLSRRFGQLHLIGSASKRARFASRLRALGHADAAIARIICPLGRKSLGKEPAAIALGLAVSLMEAQARPAEGGLAGEMTA